MVSWRLEVVSGVSLRPYLEALADLRIRVFREWPYLYAGSLEYERHYLERYIACESSVVALVCDGERIVGASTGLPLVMADEDFQAAFAGSRYVLEDVYYFGESVLLPEYRGQGIGRRFFEVREGQALCCGAKWAAFCAVDRDKHDPRKPGDYRALDEFWQKLGYEKIPNLQAHFDWQEVGESDQSVHTLTFWLKRIG